MDPREDAGPTLQGSNVPACRPKRTKYRTHEEQVQYALDTNSTFAELHTRYQLAAPGLEKLLGFPIPYSRKAQTGVVERALRRLAVTDPRKH